MAITVAGLLLAGCSVVWMPQPVPTSAPRSPAAVAIPTPAAASDTSDRPRLAVGLGDSIMAGTNCGCAGPMAAYADAIERERGARPDVMNLGVAGWTTHSPHMLPRVLPILDERLAAVLDAVRTAHGDGGATFLVVALRGSSPTTRCTPTKPAPG